MTKKTKPKPIPVNDEVVKRASETDEIKNLAEIARAYSRAGLYGPYRVKMPAKVAAYISGKKNRYGRIQIEVPQPFNLADVKIGKRDGLIFVLEPAFDMKYKGEPVDRIELTWEDLMDCIGGGSDGDLTDKICELLNGNRPLPEQIRVWDTNTAIKEAVSKNPSMHEILNKGFQYAYENHRNSTDLEIMEQSEAFGAF